jgi:hypothetical protein
MVRQALLLGLLIAVMLCPIPRRVSAAVDLEKLLRDYGRFSDSELAEVAAGKVAAKLLPTTDQRELAVIGIIRVDVVLSRFTQALRDIEGFKRSSEVLQIGKLSNPPNPRDLQRLTLEPSDVEALRGCRPGNCDVKLAASGIRRFGNEIDWASPDYSDRASDLFRSILLDYASQYLARGNSALIEYSDRSDVMRLEDEFKALLSQSTYLDDLAPEFGKYLAAFPSGRPRGAENFIYWSKESFGLKPVTSLTHVIIYQLAGETGNVTLAASKQIYANHYFDASLGLTFFFEHGSGSATPGSYLVYLNRSRVDALRGGFSKLKRTIVASDLKGGLERNLRLAKRKLEANTPRR